MPASSLWLGEAACLRASASFLDTAGKRKGRGLSVEERGPPLPARWRSLERQSHGLARGQACPTTASPAEGTGAWWRKRALDRCAAPSPGSLWEGAGPVAARQALTPLPSHLAQAQVAELEQARGKKPVCEGSAPQQEMERLSASHCHRARGPEEQVNPPALRPSRGSTPCPTLTPWPG